VLKIRDCLKIAPFRKICVLLVYTAFTGLVLVYTAFTGLVLVYTAFTGLV
jgi:hypothetical protein